MGLLIRSYHPERVIFDADYNRPLIESKLESASSEMNLTGKQYRVRDLLMQYYIQKYWKPVDAIPVLGETLKIRSGITELAKPTQKLSGPFWLSYIA